MTAAPPTVERLVAQLLGLEQKVREADSSEQLAYALVNDGQPLFGFRHAALLIAGKVRALTGIAVVEPHAPFVAFVERAAARWMKGEAGQRSGPVDPSGFDSTTRSDWQTLSAPHAFWIPLCDRQGAVFGGLWLARDLPWSEPEAALLAHLGHTYSHAWLALQPRKPWRLRWPKRRLLALGTVALLSLLVPVRQSVLAPAEVIPLDGRQVTAPLDGVIAEVVVQPNQPVHRGDLLLRFDDTALKAQAEVAERALAVAEAEHRASAQRAFGDAESGARMDLLAARVAQKRAERDYARELLARSALHAERDGIAVFADADRWTGKPVRTGERLMEIADPSRAQLRIDLAVSDAIALQPGADVDLFLDANPLDRYQAHLQRLAYEPQLAAGGALTYRLDAGFARATPRIGLRGTAKLYGDRVPLALYLLRRPLAALRQTLGL